MSEGIGPAFGGRRAAWLIAVAMLTYLCWLLTVGRFPNSDESAYKAAGREWAASGRFAAPELEGMHGFEPPLERVFASYPPLYPFFFGVWVKVLGFGWRQCVTYDGVIHCGLILATLVLARRLMGAALQPSWSIALALSMLPLGTAGRPDELGALFGTLGLCALLRTGGGPSAGMIGGLTLGLAGATSPASGVVFGLLSLPLAFSLVPRVSAFCAWAGSALLAAGAVEGPVLLLDPHAYRQFLHQPEVHRSLDVLEGFAWAPWRHGLPMVTSIVLLALVGARVLRLGDQQGSVAARRLWGMSLVALLVVVAFFPGKYTYLWLVGPCLLAVAVWSLARPRPQRFSLRMLAGGLLLPLALVAGAARSVHQGLVLVSLPPNQRLDAAAASVRQRIPAGAIVAVDELWWVMAGDFRVLDAFWSRPRRPDQIDWVVLSGNGTGQPGRPRRLLPGLSTLVARCFEPEHDGLNRAPSRFWGVPLSRSGYGFSPLILRRTACRDTR